MSQALLISHRDILQDIYTLNLKAYVDTNVTCKKNINDALELLKMSPNFDLIVTQHQVFGEDAIAALTNFLKQNSLEIPLIILGIKRQDLINLVYVEDIYDIKSTIKAAAKFLEITPKLMISKQIGEYYSIPIGSIKNLEKASTDVYIRDVLPGNTFQYQLHIASNSNCRDALSKLQTQGVRSVFVLSNDRLSFVNQSTNHVISVLNDENADHEQVIDALATGHEIFAQEISCSLEMSEQMIVLSQTCVSKMENVIRAMPNLRSLIDGLVNNKAKYSYKHSMIAAYVANYMIKNIHWSSKGQSDKISFVFFFHDIFLGPIIDKFNSIESEEELLFSDNLSDLEKDVILTHAFMASELSKSFPNLPMGADSIILQHHGTKTGREFAVEYPDHIAPLAKVAIIAEKMTEAMLIHLNTIPETPFNSDKCIKELAKMFPKDSYRKLVVSLKGITI